MNEITAYNACKHSQIIAAAIAEFQEKGFAAASMDHISARAEVSKRTLYKYFESKENLFRSLFEVLSNRLKDGVDVTYSPDLPVREQLAALAWAEGRVLMQADVISLSRLIISETLRNPDLSRQAQAKIDAHSGFESVLRAAAEDGALQIADPAEAAVEFLGLIKAKAFWPIVFGADPITKARMAEIVQSSVDMMISRYAKAP